MKKPQVKLKQDVDSRQATIQPPENDMAQATQFTGFSKISNSKEIKDIYKSTHKSNVNSSKEV